MPSLQCISREGSHTQAAVQSTSSVPEGDLPVVAFAIDGRPVVGAQLSDMAERYPIAFHSSLQKQLSELHASGLARLWLPEAESRPLHMLALAGQSVGITIMVGTAQRPTGALLHSNSDRDGHAPEGWLAHLLTDNPVEIEPCGRVATHNPARTTLHVPQVLGFESWIFKPSLREAADVDIFYKWGVRQTLDRARLERAAAAYGRPTFIAEDGLFLRSLGLGVGDERQDALSFSIDTQTAYYDATRPSRLEQCLNEPRQLTPAQRQRAGDCIAQIRHHRLSKYNHAPDSQQRYGSLRRPKVLLLDQRHLDSSVRYGLASAASFDAMFDFAARERREYDILLKPHPDAMVGGTRSYFTPERIARLQSCSDRVFVITDQVNPHALLDQVEQVFVVTSGFGFEAALAGLQVHCFGVPFYAGWGLTQDHAVVPRRHRTRDAVELFHYAAIEAATYWSPELERRVSIEAAIERMAALRAKHGLT